jgi:hypothetical protein
MNRNMRILLAIGLALVSAALTIFILFSMKPTKTLVLVASQDISPCTVLASSHVAVLEVDAATMKELFGETLYPNGKELIGKTVVRHLRKNEVFTLNDRGVVKQSQLDQTHLSSSQLSRPQRLVLTDSSGSANACDFVEIHVEKDGRTTKVLDRSVQIASTLGGMIVLVDDTEVQHLLEAQAQGALHIVTAPTPDGKQP